jgi:spore germination protein
MRWIAPLTALALGLLSSAVAVPGARAAARRAPVRAEAARAAKRHAASRPQVQAFLLSSAPESLRDLKTHAGAIAVVYPTYFYCETPGGQIVGADVPAITAAARALHKTVMPRFSCQEGTTVHTLLTEPAARARTLAGLVRIARDPSYQGLSLDLENDGAADREALSTFVATLAQRLHALGKKLTVVVDGVTGEDLGHATAFYDDRALSAAADAVFVLAWGAHWEGSAPGPIAPLSYVEGVAAYLASLPNAARFVLGTPMFGLDWPEQEGRAAGRGTAYQYTGILSLARTVGATPVREPVSGEMTFAYTSPQGIAHRVWYLDAHAIVARMRIARAHGLRVGVWRLGSEDQTLWSSLPAG